MIEISKVLVRLLKSIVLELIKAIKQVFRTRMEK